MIVTVMQTQSIHYIYALCNVLLFTHFILILEDCM